MSESNKYLPDKWLVVKFLLGYIAATHCDQVQKYGFVYTTDDKKMPSFSWWRRRSKTWSDIADSCGSLSSCSSIAPKLPKSYIVIIKVHLLDTWTTKPYGRKSDFYKRIYMKKEEVEEEMKMQMRMQGFN